MKRFFSVNGQVLVVQSTHDNATVEGLEVTEADHLAFLAEQEKKRADADAVAYLASDKAHKEKLTQAQGVYDEAVKLGFTALSAEAMARGAYAGWSKSTTSTTTTTTSGTASPMSFPSLVSATSKAAGSIVKTANTLAWDAGGWGDKPGTILMWQANTVGATAMLTWTPQSAVGNPDWKAPAHGLYIAGSSYSIYEFGVEKAKGSFALSDLFTITLVGTAVIYAKNSTLIYTSTKYAAEPLIPAALLRSYNIELTNLKFMQE